MPSRHVTADAVDPRERYGLYRLCDCPTCDGRGQVVTETRRTVHKRDVEVFGGMSGVPGVTHETRERCPDCRGEGRVRQELASCATPEAVGVALVTLAREAEWSECPLGLLDRLPECETCGGDGRVANLQSGTEPCSACKGSGVKPTGTWLILPWLPSARNVTDAARTLGKEGARKRTAR